MRALTPEGLAAPLLPSSLIPERTPAPTLKAQLNQLAQQQASEDAVQKAIALMNLQLIARDMAVTLLRRRYENQQVLLASQPPVTVHNPLAPLVTDSHIRHDSKASATSSESEGESPEADTVLAAPTTGAPAQIDAAISSQPVPAPLDSPEPGETPALAAPAILPPPPPTAPAIPVEERINIEDLTTAERTLQKAMQEAFPEMSWFGVAARATSIGVQATTAIFLSLITANKNVIGITQSGQPHEIHVNGHEASLGDTAQDTLGTFAGLLGVSATCQAVTSALKAKSFFTHASQASTHKAVAAAVADIPAEAPQPRRLGGDAV